MRKQKFPRRGHDYGLARPAPGYSYSGPFAHVRHTADERRQWSESDPVGDWVAYRGTIAEPHLSCRLSAVYGTYRALFSPYNGASFYRKRAGEIRPFTLAVWGGGGPLENLTVVPMTDRHRAILGELTAATVACPASLFDVEAEAA